MKIIERKQYLDRLIRLRGTPDIKILSGLRRAGKLEIIKAYMKYLEDKDTNIIYIDFDNLRFDDLKNYKDRKDNILIIDEVQMCRQFELAVLSKLVA